MQRVFEDSRLRVQLREKLDLYINKGMIDFIPVYNDNRDTTASKIEDILET